MDIDLDSLLAAIALVLVFEGLLPFVSPETWRKTMRSLLECSDKSVRIIGFTSMLIGTLALLLIHSDY